MLGVRAFPPKVYAIASTGEESALSPAFSPYDADYLRS